MFAALFLVAPLAVLAQTPAPIISKVDPPNWWVSLPNPMLLVRGENLDSATFAIEGTGVSIKKTRVSANGHWAFIWLLTGKTNPQTIQVVARSRNGAAKFPFQIEARNPKTENPKGITTSDVIYELMPDRFARASPLPTDEIAKERTKPRGWHGGDLKGVEEHLDYIQHLGATAVWLTPVYNNSPAAEAYHGYEATDMYAIDPHFGNVADFKELSAALHSRGMKLVFDTVPNHTGPNHPWVADPPTPDWFHGSAAKHTRAQGDFRPLVDPHASHLDRRDITEGWFGNTLPDLNAENPIVSEYLIQNTIWWIESAGIDALRLDTFPYVARGFWRDFHSRLHSIYPNLVTFAETFNLDPRVTSYFAGGNARESIDTHLDSLMDYPLAGAIRSVLNDGAPMTTIWDVLSQDWLYPHPERLVTFIGNHDNKRILADESSPSVRLKLGFGLLATLRGIPQLYTGDEIAMRGGDDPDNRRDFPGGFPGDTRDAFDATQRTAQEQEMHKYVTTLLHYRSAHPVLQAGQQENMFVDDSSYLFARVTDRSHGCATDMAGSERLLVAANNSKAPRELTIDITETALEGCKTFEPSFAEGAAAQSDGGKVSFHLAPQSLVIYRAK